MSEEETFDNWVDATEFLDQQVQTLNQNEISQQRVIDELAKGFEKLVNHIGDLAKRIRELEDEVVYLSGKTE